MPKQKNQGGRPQITKGKKQVVVPVSMSEAQKKDLENLAGAFDVSRSEVVRQALRFYMDFCKTPKVG